MNINKILLLFLPLSLITTACSNTVNNQNSSYNQLPASIRLCYLNEKIIDSEGNSFQIMSNLSRIFLKKTKEYVQ